MTIHHFYVDRDHRRRGIGRALMDRLVEVARSAGAVTLWLETSNVNVPGGCCCDQFAYIAELDIRAFQAQFGCH